MNHETAPTCDLIAHDAQIIILAFIEFKVERLLIVSILCAWAYSVFIFNVIGYVADTGVVQCF